MPWPCSRLRGRRVLRDVMDMYMCVCTRKSINGSLWNAEIIRSFVTWSWSLWNITSVSWLPLQAACHILWFAPLKLFIKSTIIDDLFRVFSLQWSPSSSVRCRHGPRICWEWVDSLVFSSFFSREVSELQRKLHENWTSVPQFTYFLKIQKLYAVKYTIESEKKIRV